MKHVTLCLLFVCILSTSALANDITNKVQVDSIFGTKVVLCSIDFLTNSTILSEQAKAVLDDVVAQLEEINTDTRSIRIEGFPGILDTATELSRLSLRRAMAVEEYFRLQHMISFERFLTGHKAQDATPRVEISIYDNMWQIDVQVANKDKKDGPS